MIGARERRRAFLILINRPSLPLPPLFNSSWEKPWKSSTAKIYLAWFASQILMLLFPKDLGRGERGKAVKVGSHDPDLSPCELIMDPACHSFLDWREQDGKRGGNGDENESHLIKTVGSLRRTGRREKKRNKNCLRSLLLFLSLAYFSTCSLSTDIQHLEEIG